MCGPDSKEDPRLYLPPCEQAQADGVPCPDVGRDCEVCEKAYAEWRKRDSAPQADGDG
ncbi:MAG: hypothetical protein ACYTGZ_16910 [Planctomycetota bacterium]